MSEDDIAKIVASPTIPTRAQVAQSERIDWEACAGCDGKNCPTGFIPNWKRLGFKSREAALNGSDELAKGKK